MLQPPKLYIVALVMFQTSCVQWLSFIGPAFGQTSGSPGMSNTVLVMDASRSMWGQIDGINKIVSLRKVVKESFERFQGRTKMALVAYGHQQESGCGDVALVRKLGAIDAAGYSNDVDTIRPKGSTPIANALKLAAASSGPAHQRANIILIADGLDNCRGDPCATAASLRQTHSGLAVHVIAFDKNSKKTLKALSCVSTATSGSFATASNESELKIALTNALDLSTATPTASVQTLPSSASGRVGDGLTASGAVGSSPSDGAVSAGDTQRFAQAVTPPPSAGFGTTTVAPTTAGKTPVTLVGVLNEGGAQISSGLIWRIYETQADPGGQYPLLSTHSEAMPTFLLEPGDYLVNAAYGRAHLTKKIKVANGQALTEQFVLNAGGLRLSAVLANGEQIAANDVTYDISSDDQDQFGNRDKILSNAKPGLIYRLNAGIYRIMSRYGNVNAVVEADVTVEPGKLTEATINHRAARVTFKLVLRPGGDALANTQWQIINKAGEEIKSSAGALPSHILAAGDYTVIAKHSGRDYQMAFTVNSGDAKQVEVVIQ